MAKPGGAPAGTFSGHFPAMFGGFQFQPGTARRVFFKKLADDPTRALVADRLPVVRKRMAELRERVKKSS